jgi:hypothetical protein
MTHRGSALARLAGGEVHDFGQAMWLLIRAYNDEIAEARDEAAKDGAPLDEDHRQAFEGYRATTLRCVEQYEAHIAALAEAWLQDADEDVRRFGETLKSGDYSDLAF